MENRLLSFSEFEAVYESYGFINESETAEKPTFTPNKLTVSSEDLLSIFEEDAEEQNEALKPAEFTLIKKGETGSDRVKELQKNLGIKVTGNFDEATDKAVRDFQTKNKLTIDGKVGIQTLTKMLELKGVKDTEKVIRTKYIIVKSKDDAKKSGINPLLLEIYDITIVNNGQKEYVICVPKKDSKNKINKLSQLGTTYDWVKLGLNSAGKALVYTATGVALIPLEMAKAMISGVASATKFITGGAAYVLGATIQGLSLLGKWFKEKGKAIYMKSNMVANEVWKSFSSGMAWTAGKLKDGAAVLTAFMKGVVSVAKTIGYTLTGIALTAWKGLSKALSPVVNGIVQGAKDASAFINSGTEWVTKNFNNGIKAFNQTVAKGWESVKQNATLAFNAAKDQVNSAGDAFAKAATDAANSIGSFFTDMYNTGKAFWE